jgi:putative FmdB family regulatory protein
MPTYEYECERGHTFEKVQSIKDKPLEKCVRVHCTAKVKRLINFQGGIVFKGSGWTGKFH